MADSADYPEAEKVVIKKYANRRLYNTASSTYVTLEHLSDMVKQGIDFAVYDAKTGEDITRPVLTQIIFDEESRGQNLLPITFLRQLIRFYGDSMQAFVPGYLELSLENFTKQQERLRSQFSVMPALPGLGMFDEQVKQNMAMFERAMKMFTPFGMPRPDEAPTAAAPPPSPPPQAETPKDDGLADLKKQLEAMQQQINKLAKG